MDMLVKVVCEALGQQSEQELEGDFLLHFLVFESFHCEVMISDVDFAELAHVQVSHVFGVEKWEAVPLPQQWRIPGRLFGFL